MAADSAPGWADQAFLRNVQYATDRNLAARQSIYAYQRPTVHLAARVLQTASLSGAEVIADVGCGNGMYLAELARCGHVGPMLGVDMSPGMLAAARESAPAARLLAGDATALPLRDRISDLTLAMHMLYHVPEPARAVSELRRVTRPGGQLVVGLNGDDHLRELRDLINDSLAGAGRHSALVAGEPIMLDQGEELLAGFFSTVIRHDLCGELALPGPQPVIDYVRSMISRDHGAQDRLAAGVAGRLTFGPDGLFRVRTHAGWLICR